MLQDYRPNLYIGKGDRTLSKVADDLIILLTCNRSSWYPLNSISSITAEILGEILVEFAEDIHNDIGIWDAYEQYNREFFGTPLPMILKPGDEIEPRVISPERIAHIVYTFSHQLLPKVRLVLDSPGLAHLSEDISSFLNERFVSIPRDSGIKKFLSVQVRQYHEVKKRLIWLGTKSYMFREVFEKYTYDREDENLTNIQITDDFVNQATTPWSGLGVIDILASVMDISPERKAEIRSWYERHYAIYRIERRGKDFLEVTNLISNKPYYIHMELKTDVFKPGLILSGSLVMWNNEWYWSGQQESLKITDEKINYIREEFVRNNPEIVFRYTKDLAETAMESNRKQREFFFLFFGDNLAVFLNPEEFSRGIGDFYREYIRTCFPDAVGKSKDFMVPTIPEDEGKVGVFFDARGGLEIMTGFGEIEDGFKKKGKRLTNEEVNSIGAFMHSKAISPNFVRKLVKMYGDKSISVAWGIPNPDQHPFLEFILRRYKAESFRTVYPPIGFTNFTRTT